MATKAKGEKRVGPVLTPEEEEFLKGGAENISQGEIETWEEGRTFTGTFVRMRDGGVGPLILADGVDGTRHILACPTILRYRMEDVEAGNRIMIRCLGQIPNSKGQPTWDFVVLKKR